MSAMQTEVFEAFRAIDVPEDKALRAAAALTSAFARAEHETAKNLTKRDSAIDRLSGEVASLGAKLSADGATLNGKLTAEVASINNKISAEIATLNGKLSAEIATLNNRLSAEVASINNKITAEVAALNQRITTEVASLNAKIVKLDGDVALLKWMVGFNLAMLVTLLFRSFTH